MSVRGEVHPSSAPWTLDVRARLRDYLQLAKVRLSSMVLLSALVGYWLAAGELELGHLLWFATGTFWVVAGANAINQVLERESDARMKRTARRPVPAERLSVPEASFVAGLMSTSGVVILFATCGTLCAGLALLALGTYVLVYTPMKSRSPWSTLPGAVAGAIPPLMGFSAVSGSLSPIAWALFGVLFFWQFPHTWAIASTYREDYARVGYRALPVRGTRARTITATAALVASSFAPVALGLAGELYLVGVALLGVFILTAAFRFGDGTTKSTATQLLAASLIYLPLVLALFALNTIRGSSAALAAALGALGGPV
jgi:protoheme IX farnesyltransferase